MVFWGKAAPVAGVTVLAELPENMGLLVAAAAVLVVLAAKVGTLLAVDMPAKAVLTAAVAALAGVTAAP